MQGVGSVEVRLQIVVQTVAWVRCLTMFRTVPLPLTHRVGTGRVQDVLLNAAIGLASIRHNKQDCTSGKTKSQKTSRNRSKAWVDDRGI